MLAEQAKAKAGRPSKNSSDDTRIRGAPTLSDIRISYQQSSD
jgi:hypothetical protein